MSRGSSIPWKMLTPNEQNCAKNTPPPAPGPLERGIPREEGSLPGLHPKEMNYLLSMSSMRLAVPGI